MRRKEVFGQRAVLARPEAMSSVAVRNFEASASVIRPTSPYLKAPPLAHSTTSAIGCFLDVATRRATVKNSLRSWLNPEAAADPLLFLCTGGEGGLPAGGLAEMSTPAAAVPFPDEEDCAAGFGPFAADLVPVTELGSALSAG